MLAARSSVRRGAGVAALLLIALGAAEPAGAQTANSGLKVTIAARVCDRYTDIFGNRARNNIMESLKDLGPDTPYQSGQPVGPDKEDLSPQSRCNPLPNWRFTLGTGYQSRAVTGPWGALSIVTGAFSTSIVTQTSVPELNLAGQPTGGTIAGATTIELTQQQANLAAQANRLWIQGGTTTDPVLNGQFPGEYGFGALRCAIDNLNGDNVEWISYPSGGKHVFCYAYYVKPPPTSGTIIVRKQIDAPAGTARQDFRFTGNISFASDESFTLNAGPGSPASTTFYRAEVTGLTPEWSFAEQVPQGWTLTGISCTSQTGGSTTTTDLASARTSVRLAASDTVTCTYTDRLTPPPAGLQLSKVTLGAVGTFSWDVTPAAGGAAKRVSATTTAEDVTTPGTPNLTLDPGTYRIQEDLPDRAGGRWKLDEARCNGRIVPDVQPVTIGLTAGQGAFCTFTNEFVPNGTIRLRKRTVGATGTVGFVISPDADASISFEQSATTTEAGETVLAKGDDTSSIALGRYVIQETTPSEPTNGFWVLESVTCNGVPEGSSQGRIIVTLTAAHPDADCTFTNRFTKGPEPPTPNPDDGSGGDIDPAERPQADLVLTKRATPRRTRVGAAVRYTLTLTNRGPDTAEDVTGVEVSTKYTTPLKVRPSRGTCTSARPIVCNVGSLKQGERVVFRVTTRFKQAGTYPNTASVNTSTFEAHLRDNAATTTVRVRPRPRFVG